MIVPPTFDRAADVAAEAIFAYLRTCKGFAELLPEQPVELSAVTLPQQAVIRQAIRRLIRGAHAPIVDELRWLVSESDRLEATRRLEDQTRAADLPAPVARITKELAVACIPDSEK